MTNFQPQNAPGVIKRLSFEQLGGDDYSRGLRVQKGITREIVTPKYSVPYSREGTKLNEYVDRNDVVSAVQARNELIRLVVLWYPVVKLRKAILSYINDNTTIKNLLQMKYLPESESVSAETYSNG